MDVILSSKPQTLTLISPFSFSSSNSSPSPSPFSHRICSLQREFLGCNHRFRPPRRKCKKLGFQIQIQPCRFNFRASLASQPVIIVVAVATISALTVVYLNYTRRRHELKQVSGHKDADSLKSIEKSKHGTDSLKQGTESGILDHHKLNVNISVVKRKALIGKMSENGHVSGNGHASEEKEVQYQTAASLNLETLTTKASGLLMLDASSNILASNGVGAVSTKEPEGMGLILPHQLHGELDRIESLSSQVGLAEFISEGLEEAELGSKLPRLIDDPVSSASDIHVEYSPGETNQDYKPDHETVEGMHHQVSDYKGFFRESLREELHTFYEENHSGVSSISNSRNVKVMSPNSFLHSNSLPSRPSMLNGTEFSAQDSLRTSVSVYLEGKASLACYHKGSSGNGKDLNKVTNIGKVFPPQNSQRDLHGLPQLTGRHDNAKHDQKEYFKTYNCLLREGRLADCIELLESMEQRGLLDMDKVYHVKFFNTCKNQKAVNEAFRFTKLIGNPTLSTFNMLLSVCASSQDSEGAFQVLQLVKQAGLKADCKLYTTLISTCAKCGKVDAMFEVFHEMVNVGIEPNLHTYGALIDGCARAGQVAKAFGAYGILRSKKVKPDRVVFNALITACGQSGAVQRAFDVLAEMRAEPTPVDPDHVTVGALIKTCIQAGQFDRAREVYNMLHQYNIKGTPEVYTIAVNSCSKIGDLDFALSIYRDMTRNGVVPDEMFLSALMDVAGHAGKADVALEFLQEARNRGAQLGKVAYSSLMGACSNAKNWQKALEVYEDIKSSKLHPTVSTLNALVTALCDGDQLQKAVECLTEMKKLGVRPNVITYTVLLIASDKRDEVEIGSMLHSQAKKDGVVPNLIMCRCLIGMCSRRFQKAYSLGEKICSFESGKPQIDNKWTSLALAVYREIIVAGVLPTMEVFSLVLACLQFPHDTSLRDRLVENLRVSTDASRCSNLNPLLDGFGEYDPRSFSLLEEAASLGIVPCVSFKERPIIVDARKLHIHTAEVYLLTVLKGLKHRLAAGAKLPNINIILPVEKIQVLTPKGEKTIKLTGRVGQAVGALMRRLGLPYQGNESFGKIRINGISVKRWFQPKLHSPFSGKPTESNSSQMLLAKGITDQQRNIRTSNFSLESDAK